MLRAFRIVCAVSLGISAALFVAWSWRWPLVGDASLIHYIVFLMERGRAPYRNLGDMNMPGSFLMEQAAMWVFGAGALGWRMFDFSLLAAAGAAFAVLLRRAGWFPALFAGTLLALVHGRDGLAQGGQRDLTMAVLLVASTAALFEAISQAAARPARSRWGFAVFGLLAGLALTIKPTALPLSMSQLLIAGWVLRREELPVLRSIWPSVTVVLGPLLALGFLLRQGALGAFLHGLRTVVPYYASLGHRPLGYLLLHSLSPLLALVLLWLAVLALARPRLEWQRVMLLAGVLFGLISYVVQARGLPYYRYPLLAFLLPLLALDFSEALAGLSRSGWRRRLAVAAAAAGIAVGALVIAPQSAWQIGKIRWWQTEFTSTLEQNLRELGGAALADRVQCVDSISGCGTALYDLRLQQQTGVLSDFLLFGPASLPVVEETRREFAGSVFEHPPQVIVVSSWLHLDGPGNYEKLARWPELQEFLAAKYTLRTTWRPAHTQRWWSREELPAGYRIYVLR